MTSRLEFVMLASARSEYERKTAGVRSDIRTRSQQSGNWNCLIPGQANTLRLSKTPLEVVKAEVVSECQT
jgi:hypothetical protein